MPVATGPIHSQPLRCILVLQGDGGPAKPAMDSFIDAEELAEYAAECTSTSDQDALRSARIRFPRETAFALALGEQSTGGWRINVVGAELVTGGAIGIQTVISYVVEPPAGAATQVLTWPHVVVRAKGAGGLTVFRKVSAEAPAPTTPRSPKPPAEGWPTTTDTGEEVPGHDLGPGVGGGSAAGYTTKALGEEHMTTLRMGEEGMTTMAYGEEGPGPFGTF